ncbi:hypothetical protein [Nocardioides aurantiacus]|uniref:hypothetical protein n=1 Tax=Nocardioides aurantiacus TaxID=86796 RepID=UPI00403F2AE0
MGSWWHVQVGAQEVPVFGKSYVSDQLMLLLTDEDFYLDHTKNRDMVEFETAYVVDPDRAMGMPRTWHDGLMGYSSTVANLRTRLDLQGFSADRVQTLAIEFFEENFDDDPGTSRATETPFRDGASLVAALTHPRGLAAGSGPGFGAGDPNFAALESEWMSLRENFHDLRFTLALSLLHADPDAIVDMDLSDLVAGGWLSLDDRPHREARLRMAADVANGGPVIVITEGSSDARWLRRSLEISAPAVAYLFEFLDFAEFRTPGGTDRVVSLTKGMASAGVMNRVVAVLDNDTAGHLAAGQLRSLALPGQVAVVTLPDVGCALTYPTLGPDGATASDVNGRAVSIEFMFGVDVLRDADGAFFPVRWTSFLDKAGEYQGSLDARNKNLVAANIDAALHRATDAVPAQVREGCDRLVEVLVDAARRPDALH